jgi:tetratricopeptide (TPR) repeat protein
MPTIRRRLALAGLLLLVASPAWSQSDAVPQNPNDIEAGKALAEGVRLMQSSKTDEALATFTRVAADYDGKFNDSKQTYFSARTPTESLLYLTQMAAQGGGKNGTVVAANWGYAHYLKGYALIELRRVPEAKAALSRAVALSPQNAQFLGELGHIYEVEKNWPQALQLYQRAESAAKEFSPPNARNAELSRAWRGEGYVLVELKRWDEAERRYRQCLALDKNDTRAQQELLYIQRQKAAAKPG